MTARPNARTSRRLICVSAASALLLAASLTVPTAIADDRANTAAHEAQSTSDIWPTSTPRAIPPQPDFTKSPVLYVVAYAHLDTEWRWAYPQTIREYIPATLHRNFELFEKYPGYVFNFSGSRRYQMMEEYYPADFATLKKYVAQGKWFPCGSSVDENDANVPSAESLVRQVLYGNKYFRENFGVASDEYMLPDCFGFPAALPSVLAHCGLTGFSTQKLTWGVAVPMPFKVGTWNGPDGRGVIAALDPGAYVGEVTEDLSKSERWLTRINNNAKVSGSLVDYHYYGTGDTGGAPTEGSVRFVENALKSDGRIKIVSSQADWMFNAFNSDMRATLPTYSGELLLTEHSAGSISSQAYMKRWNRKNELLADATERVSVLAHGLGARPYPSRAIEEAWYLVLGSQMHDILPGTSIPKAYEFAWNDEALAGNIFSHTLTDSLGAAARMLDTTGTGTPLIVYNASPYPRKDVVQITIPLSKPLPSGQVIEINGPAPVQAAQIISQSPTSATIAFMADVKGNSLSTFYVVPDTTVTPQAAKETATAEGRTLENSRYKVTINEAGDVASIFDKAAKRELLQSPARLGLHYEKPAQWPAWNQDWKDRQRPATGFVDGPAKIEVLERGPVRASIRVTREAQGSTFDQVIRLSAGSERVEFVNTIDWRTKERSLRASFPLTVSNPKATFDIQTGAIERPNSNAKCFEYPVHQWMDLTDAKGDYGVTIINDSKFACDKPDDSTLRLTLLFTPGVRGEYQDQATQDIGRHEITYAIVGHAGDWKAADAPAHAMAVNQPLTVFATAKHQGPLGKWTQIANTDERGVMISAIKKAEHHDAIIVRLRETHGKQHDQALVSFFGNAISAHEVDGQERIIGPASVRDGRLVASVHPYGLRAYAVTLARPSAAASPATEAAAAVHFVADTRVATSDDMLDAGAMDEQGRSYPIEQLRTLWGRTDTLRPPGKLHTSTPQALTCNGQTIDLPAGEYDTLRILAAASGEADVAAPFLVDTTETTTMVNAWGGFIGQWDNRLWLGVVPEQAFRWTNEWGGLVPGFIKPQRVEWHASHHHHPKGGNAHYLYSYIHRIEIPITLGAKKLTLPKDKRIKVFAMDVVKGAGVYAITPLFDTLHGRKADSPRIIAPDKPSADSVPLTIEPGLYWRDGGIRYTTDGAEPTAASPVYKPGVLLAASATIKAASVDASGRVSPVVSREIKVNDTTPPRIVSARSSWRSTTARVQFSEPIDPRSISGPGAIGVVGGKVVSATIAGAGDLVEIKLAEPMPDAGVKVVIDGVKDRSPAGNAMARAEVAITPPAPVFTLDEVKPEQFGTAIASEALPTKAAQPWTLNMLVWIDKQPDNRTVIAGFGTCADKSDGIGRYIAKFSGGAHFWSRNRDVSSQAKLDLGKWQMLTAVSDGKSVTLYKDGRRVGVAGVTLTDDAAVFNIAPVDPWEGKRRFEGRLRRVSVWNGAMDDEAVATLYKELEAARK